MYPQELKLPMLPSEDATFLESQENICTKYENGKLQEAFLTKDGKLHGQALGFYPSGKKKYECFYFEGKLHGYFLSYFEDGQVSSKSFYQEGVKEGEEIFYYLEGEVYSRQFYRKGFVYGSSYYYYPDRSLKAHLQYEEGRLHGTSLLYWPSGKIRRLVSYYCGEREGVDAIFNEEEIALEQGNYLKNTPSGIHIVRYPNGNIKEVKDYISAYKVNTKRWDEDQVLIYESMHLENDRYIERSKKNSVWKEQKGVFDGRQVLFF